MRLFAAAFFAVGAAAILALAGVGLGSAGGAGDFLRLHVRANSNSAADQEVKYLVKQHIVDALTPIFYDVTDKHDAVARLADNLEFIESIAARVLSENGFDYGARAAIKSEYFPTRAYAAGGNDIVLPQGVYDALILELGAGEGDNWWCVVYPPLCFLENNIGGAEGVRYRFKILEWVK